MANTGGGQWEVVGKFNKKNKPQGHGLSKTQKKMIVENMPKIEVAPPVKEDATIYDAFMEKGHDHEKGSREQGKPTSNGTSAKSKSTQGKKKPAGGDGKKRDQPTNLEDALKKVDCGDFETVLSKDQATFPENPSVWLKDLASMLNLQLENVPESDPIFHGKSKDYPVCLVPRQVKKLLDNVLTQCSTHTLDLFFDHCVQSMINDIGKGIPTYGYRIFIQLMAYSKPDFVISGLPKHLKLLQSHQGRPLRQLSIMWAVGQAGLNKLSNGLKVWLELMQPVLKTRALSAYAVDYLDGLFKNHKDLKEAYGVLGYRNFFHLLDIIFAPSSNLPTNLQKKLLKLYPNLKAIAVGGDPGSTLWSFFPSFLVRAVPNCNLELKTELLSCLVECLATDRLNHNVWRQWRQMYVKHLTQSSVLLNHLVAEWESVGKRLERKTLQETIRGFSITNEELATQGQNSEGYHNCVTACKELLAKMSTPRFPWRMLVLLIVAVFVGIVSYDIYINNGFKKSRTARLLKDTGLLVFLEQVWNRLRIYSAKALAWLQENVPYYYAKTCEFVGPYLQLFWEKLYLLGVWVAEITAPGRAWLNKKVPEFIEWVQSKVPWLWDTCSHYLKIVWQLTLQYSLWLWRHLVHFMHVSGTWLQENVFTGSWSGENIQKVLSSSFTTVQSYSSSFLQWCVQLWTGKPAAAQA